MKKTYITPETLLTLLSNGSIIAASETVDLFDDGGSDQLVKGNQTAPSTPSYNVWNDDWSE